VMQPKPLLFLDFDGVLHPTSAKPQQWFSCVDLLAEVLEGTQCEIVISSSWRFTHSLSELRALLPINLAERTISTTGPAYIGKFARYTEIQSFIGSRLNLRWMALDDCAWDFPKTSQLIACNPNNGLTRVEAEKVRQWLQIDIASPQLILSSRPREAT
jgi:hypothetical protein